MPLGYTCVLFEKDPKGGGLMRTQHPLLPPAAAVLDEEVDRIAGLGSSRVSVTRSRASRRC